MSIGIKIKKGLDLQLAGAVADTSAKPRECPTATVAIVPDDFTGIIPRMELREGDPVATGQALFHSKTDEDLKVVSPAAGTLKAVVRGERRKIERVIVEVDGADAVTFPVKDVFDNADAARRLLLQSGQWAMMRQRPFDIVPGADAQFRDIFVTGFDLAPLAVSQKHFSDADTDALTAGVKLLGLLTSGNV